MKKVVGAGIIATIFVLGLTAQAADIRGGEEMTLRQEETVDDDLYIVGGSVVVAGAVKGDLIGAGGDVLVTGLVTEDVLLGGGSIQINAPIGGDIRAVGGKVVISNTVGGDVVVVGGTTQIVSGAQIEGDVVVAGGEIFIDGTILGKLTVVGESLQLNGTLNGDSDVTVDKLVVGPNAKISNGISYKSARIAKVDENAEILGEIKYTERESKRVSFALLSTLAVTKLLMLLALGLVLSFAFRKQSTELVRDTARRFTKSIVWGFVISIMVPAIVLLLVASVIGAFLALVILLAYILLVVVSAAYAGILLGSIAFKRLFKQDDYHATWDIVAAGLLMLSIINLIPVVGLVVTIIFFLASLGGLSQRIYERVARSRVL
jgi:hypothetical protein